MKTVAVVVQTSAFGGPHNQVLRLAGPLSRLGWRTVALLPLEEGPAVGRLTAAGIEVVRMPFLRMRRPRFLGSNLGYLLSLRRQLSEIAGTLRSVGPDVVQICGLTNVLPAVAAHKLGLPVCWQLLSDYPPPWLRRALMPIVRRCADSLMTTGKTLLRSHPGAETFAARDGHFPFFPPVDVGLIGRTPYEKERSSVRAECGIPEDAFVIGTVGNRTYQKAHERLVEAAARLAPRVPKLRTLIVGAPVPSNARYYERDVVGRAESLGLLGSKVHLVSTPSDVYRYLAAMDLFCLTSRAEGVPTVALEALCAGLPVLSVNVGAVDEAVRIVGGGGRTVEAHDAAAFDDSVVARATSGPMRGPDRRALRDRAAAAFSADVCALVHASAYRRAAEHREQGRDNRKGRAGPCRSVPRAGRVARPAAPSGVIE